MIASHRRWIVLAVGSLSVALLISAPAAEAVERAWEQDRLTELAEQFAEAASEVRTELHRQGSQSVASMQARAHHEFVDQVRLVTREAKHLASELKAGRSHDGTFPVYRRIQSLIRSAQTNARKLFVQAPVQEKIDAARAILDQIEPFYAEK
jgi:hypothetical protein